ncbi:MAG: D-glycerate dehydrogenase [Candidatus Acidiferrales bacterium]
MSKPKILVTRTLPAPAEKILNDSLDVDYARDPLGISRDEMLRRVVDKDGLVCQLNETINEELLAAAPRLKVVATVSVGFNNIDVAACTRRKILATNTPGVLDDTTADFAFALMLAVARRVVEGDKFLRSGEWTGWNVSHYLGSDVWGKTLGILGFGRIGKEVARRASGFKMRVIYNNRRRADVASEREVNATFVNMDTLLRESDFLSIHAPLTPETKHIISKDALAKMKPTAYLINTARGPVVDEAALNDALENKVIAGAGLDVYEREPEVTHGLIPRHNVVLAPHLGSASVETREKMAVLAATNVAEFFAGRRPPTPLNPEVLAP